MNTSLRPGSYAVIRESVAITGALQAAYQNLFDELRRSIVERVASRDFDGAEHLIAQARKVDDASGVFRPVTKGTITEAGQVTSETSGSLSRLEVTLEGRIVAGPDAATVFARTLILIGGDRIAGLGFRLSGISLASRQRLGSYHSLRHIDGWWICTHSNTKAKKRLLDDIAKRLGLEAMTVRVTE